MYATVEEALGEGRAFWPDQPFLIQQVRPAHLSDFFSPSALVSQLRESMAERVGDDSIMDSRLPMEGMLPNEGPLVFSHEYFEQAMADALDGFAEMAKLDLSGLLIVESTHAYDPSR